MSARVRKPRPSADPVRLARCDLRACEALCCYDGAYLEPGDEERIVAALKRFPGFFAGLPAGPIVAGVWKDLGAGRKTATRPWKYRRHIPGHFNATRCVFADDEGLCRLESAARANDLHPWLFKPVTCFLFPLLDEDPAAGPAGPGQDPHDCGPEYPGYATIVDCGRHQPGGQPWRKVLREELGMLETPIDAYFAEWRASD